MPPDPVLPVPPPPDPNRPILPVPPTPPGAGHPLRSFDADALVPKHVDGGPG